MNKFIVITTINPKTAGIERFESMRDWHIILVGDKKSPSIKSSVNLTFLSVDDQKNLGYQFAERCPYNHYTRKNIGYLYAIQNGADVIYDTDDDNLPYDDWHMPAYKCRQRYVSNSRYLNVYKHFTDEHIWPRGYPLDEVCMRNTPSIKKDELLNIGVWQGLADIDPDVDAIYRLTVNKDIRFNKNTPVALSKGLYSPFNSQNTFWTKDAFPYLYLPATTSFRFTDILRGYIAQRLLWEHNLYLGFCGATVYQERNDHDLMKDFKEEVECYTNIKAIVDQLELINFSFNSISNLESVYSVLIKQGFLAQQEINLLTAWILDISKLMVISD